MCISFSKVSHQHSQRSGPSRIACLGRAPGRSARRPRSSSPPGWKTGWRAAARTWRGEMKKSEELEAAMRRRRRWRWRKSREPLRAKHIRLSRWKNFRIFITPFGTWKNLHSRVRFCPFLCFRTCNNVRWLWSSRVGKFKHRSYFVLPSLWLQILTMLDGIWYAT